MVRAVKFSKLTISIAAALAISLPTMALGQTAKERELEARIAELEKLVRSLVKGESVSAEAKPAAAKSAGGGTKITYGGFIKADMIYSDLSDGTMAPGYIGRDFLIPGTIPVGGTGEGWDLDYNAKGSRFYFKTDTTTAGGDRLRSHLEFDFYASPGGNERVSNSYNPRLRHAYLAYNGWLFGQSWSTFQNPGALPESADFIGAPEGTVFMRQAQIRYTNGPWQFSIENPETTITPYGGGGRIVTDNASLPDFVLRYNHKAEWGGLAVAGLIRQLDYRAGATDEQEGSYGLSFSGKVNLGKDDLKFMLTSGTGLGRYVGLNTANGAVLDANNNLHGIDTVNGLVAFRHWWSDQWRSTFIYSALFADNDTALTGTGVTESAESYHVTLFYSPTKKLTLGAEYLHANRQLESGADGDLDRFLFTAKYSFGSSF